MGNYEVENKQKSLILDFYRFLVTVGTMLKNSTVELLNQKANEELNKIVNRGENAEMAYVPVVLERDTEGIVRNIIDFTNYIIPEEN